MGGYGELFLMNIFDYPYQMIKDKRVASIAENGKIVAIVFFSLCNDETEHLWNWDYEYHKHNPEGKILVLEGLVCKKFSFKIVKKMKDIFYTKFPQTGLTAFRNGKISRKGANSDGRNS